MEVFLSPDLLDQGGIYDLAQTITPSNQRYMCRSCEHIIFLSQKSNFCSVCSYLYELGSTTENQILRDVTSLQLQVSSVIYDDNEVDKPTKI